MTEIRLYNSLGRELQTFEPIEPGIVRMYSCGPTVYDYAHIGNFRAFCFADLLRRLLEITGHRIFHVMNITDVGHMTEDQLADGGGQDKMELASGRLKQAKKQGNARIDNPDDPYQVAEFFLHAFMDDARKLNLRVASDAASQPVMPRATTFVPQMIDMVQTLIERGHAYQTPDGAVYYHVPSFPEYGTLSGNTLDRLVTGAGGRVDASTTQSKRHPADFLLWKPDASHLMKWDSPWGVGYPGWHVECSAMALATHAMLAEKPIHTLDIHTGGEDNLFPHHECEIAQSRGATGKTFANYWLHTRHLLVEGRKMSKSAGNFYTIRDLLERGADPAAIRYELIKTHYRSNANFTFKGLEDSHNAVEKLRRFAHDENTSVEESADNSHPAVQRFVEALANDLNISGALGELFKWINATPQPDASDRNAMRTIDHVLGVLAEQGETAGGTGLTDDEIDAMCRRIDAARAEKDYATSDALRDELTEAGIAVQISREGTTWQRKARLQ